MAKYRQSRLAATDSVDWWAVAAVIANAHERPLIILDRLGVIRFSNTAMASLMGWDRHDVIGSPWAFFCRGANGAPMEEHWLEDALSGVFRSCKCEAATQTGKRLSLSVELASVGRGPGVGLMLLVKESKEAVAPQATSAAATRGVVQYDIAFTGEELGVVTGAWAADGSPLSSTVVGRRCFEALHHRDAPCEGCPLLSKEETSWPRTAVVRPARTEAPLQFVSADRIDDDTVRVQVQDVPEGMLSGLLRAKIAGLADEARLSSRERSVLDLLLLGRAVQDISTVLSIAPRTVKFHQANILAKLGAESRADLFRLIL